MCIDCEARRKLARDALYNAKVGQAAKHFAKGVAEAVGLKPKTGRQELQAKQASPPARTKSK